MTISRWIKDREIHGFPTFSYIDVRQAFCDMPEQQVRNALYRLVKQGVIADIYRGFYTIIPVQYALRGAVPPTYYIDQLMNYLQKPYYISLLSAAELHGAAHQRPQRFSVTTLRPVVRTSSKKNNVIVWNYRQTIPQNLLYSKNSETGTILYSSPELTSVDLVQYEHLVGGLSVVATALAELVEKTDFSRKAEELFNIAPTTAIQRLGFILDVVLEEKTQAEILREQLYKAGKKFDYTPLSPHKEKSSGERDSKWKIIINQTIETDEI